MTDTTIELTVACPVCRQGVQAVGDILNQRARWCCTRCQVVGVAPLAIPEALLLEQLQDHKVIARA